MAPTFGTERVADRTALRDHSIDLQQRLITFMDNDLKRNSGGVIANTRARLAGNQARIPPKNSITIRSYLIILDDIKLLAANKM